MTRLFLSLPVVLSFIACSQIKLLPSKQNQTAELASIEKGEELAKVNNMSIREGYLDLLGKLNPRVKAQMSNPATRKQLLGNLVEQELMYQESTRRGLDQRTDVKEKAALYQRVIIAQSLLEDEVEKKALEYYNSHKEDEFTKLKISQIQVNFKKTEDEAKDPQIQAQTEKKPAAPVPAVDPKPEALAKAQQARQRLLAGEDFAKIAEELSDDKISKRKGGELGAISRNDKRMERLGLEKLVTAAFAMKNGDVSEPIETEKGYHILKVTSETELMPFDDAKKAIQFQIQKEVKDNLVKELKDKGKVVYKEAAEAPVTDPAIQPAAPAPEGAIPAQPAPEGAAPAPAPDAGTPAPGASAAPAPSAPPVAAPPPPTEPRDISPVVPKPKIAEPQKGEPAPVVPAPATPPNPAPTTPTAPGSPTPVETHP